LTTIPTKRIWVAASSSTYVDRNSYAGSTNSRNERPSWDIQHALREWHLASVNFTTPTQSSVNIKTPMVKEPMDSVDEPMVIEPAKSVDEEYDQEIFTLKQMREQQTVNPANASTETRKIEPCNL
jgi:hypothetical protein